MIYFTITMINADLAPWSALSLMNTLDHNLQAHKILPCVFISLRNTSWSIYTDAVADLYYIPEEYFIV